MRVEGDLIDGACQNLRITPSQPIPISIHTLLEVSQIVEDSPHVPESGNFDALLADTRAEQVRLTNQRDTCLQEAMLYQEMLNFNDHAIHDMMRMQQ